MGWVYPSRTPTEHRHDSLTGKHTLHRFHHTPALLPHRRNVTLQPTRLFRTFGRKKQSHLVIYPPFIKSALGCGAERLQRTHCRRANKFADSVG